MFDRFYWFTMIYVWYLCTLRLIIFFFGGGGQHLALCSPFALPYSLLLVLELLIQILLGLCRQSFHSAKVDYLTITKMFTFMYYSTSFNPLLKFKLSLMVRGSERTDVLV